MVYMYGMMKITDRVTFYDCQARGRKVEAEVLVRRQRGKLNFGAVISELT